MFKRIIARFLIFLQIYGILFQGALHANFTDNYPIRNQIHLHTSINKNGSLCLRLGTDGIDDPKELQWFDIPTDNLNSFDKKSQSKLAEGVQVEDDNLSQYSGSGLSTNDSGNGSVVNDSDLESPGISSKDQGTCFTLQGLKFTISTKGAILIKGRETYYEPKPLFLSGSGPITLDGVKASDLKITASKIAVSGFSKIDCLSIEGIGSEASFVNSGNLTAKQMFLNNLKGNNTGSITSDSLSLEKSTFVNSTKKSLIDIKTLVLGVKSHLENYGTVKVVGTQSLKQADLEFLYDYQSLNKPKNIGGMAWLKILENERNKADCLGAYEAFKSFSIEISATISGKYGLSTRQATEEEHAELVRLIKDTRHVFSDTPNLFNDFYGKSAEKLSKEHAEHITALQIIDTEADLDIKNKQGSEVNGNKAFASFGAITNWVAGEIIFEPDLKIKQRYLREGMLAETEAYTHLVLEKLENFGKIASIQNIRIHSDRVNNTKGRIHSPGKVYVHTSHLNNREGSISGVQGTTIAVGSDKFNNHDGEIGTNGETGVSSKTLVSFKLSPNDASVGTIQGDEIEIEDLSQLGETLLRSGQLIGLKFIHLKGFKMLLPGVQIKTPKLRLSLLDFLIDSKTSPNLTVIERSETEDLRLTHPYFTAGTLEIKQSDIYFKYSALRLMKERFGDDYQIDIKPTHTIDIQASIRAKGGMVVYTPAATFRYGDNASTAIHELLLEKSGLEVYASAFDFEKGTLAAKSLLAHTPFGTRFGRLVQDPNSDIFCTFGSHSQCPTSHGLGGHIRVCKYEVMGKEVNGVYDGRCLLKLPKIVPNETVVQVQKASELHGPLLNHGNFKTHDLTLDSNKESVCEASTMNVGGDFVQAGTGNLLLKRNTSKMYLTYHQHHLHWEFVNSDPASCLVYGNISQAPTSTITNEGSVFYGNKPQDKLNIKSSSFNSSIFQKEYTKAEQLDFVKQEQLALEKYKPNNQITRPCNDFAHAGCYPDLVSFLHKTNNFVGAQQVFVSETSFGNGVMLESNKKNEQLTFGGNFNSPLVVFRVGEGGMILGTRNTFYVDPKDPIRDLMTRGFSIQNTFVTPDLRRLIDQELSTKYFFALRERFFHDIVETQAFYQDIQDDIVVCDDGKGFKKSTGRAVFRYSPKLLEEEVRKECQNTLGRGYFFDNEAIDLKAIKQLHKNASSYLEEHHLLGKDLNQALMVSGKGDNKGIDYRPAKPMIFYDAVMNVEGVEELVAKLYVPEVMMDDVRGKLGSKFCTKGLIVFPKGVTIQQALETVRGKPIAKILEDFLKNNPAIKEREEQAGRLKEIDISKIDLKNSITMYGTIQADEMAIFNTGNINIHASITTKKAIINSLFGSVVLQSLVERTYLGDLANYQDVIPLKARIEALEDTLVILAKENIVILGAETFSEKGTILEALGCIYDLPVELVTQRYQSHSKGWTRDKWRNNVLSSHKSNGDFNSRAGDKQIICANYDVGENDVNIFAQKGIDSIDVKNIHQSESHTKTDSGHIFGGTKKTDKKSGSAVSVGGSYKCKLLNFYTEQGDVNLTNVTINADRVDISAIEGFVRFLLWTNSFFAGEQTSSSNMVWQSQSMKQTEDVTYFQSQIKVKEGVINVKSKGTVVQQVVKPISFFTEELQVPDFAKLINQDGGKITFQTLHEIHKCREESHQGPTQMFAALVAIAISIATAGTGSGLGAFIAESAGQVAVAATATTAATLTSAGLLTQAITTTLFTTLCSQATIAVLNSDGKAENVIKQMTSKDNLNNLLLAVIKTPGGQPTGNFFQQVLEKGIRNTGWAMFDKIIMNKPLDQGIREAWINAGIETVAQVCANKIGELYKPDVIKPNGLKTDGGYNLKTDGIYNAESINYATHKVLHGALGASFGAGLAMISNTDPRLGAVSGMFGAVLSEMMAEGFAPEMADVEQYAKDHPGTDPESLRSHFMAQAQNTANWSAFAGAVGAFGLEMDVNTAHRTGKNAVDNNFIPGIFLAITVATIFEYPQYLRDSETDKLHVALGKMGIEVAKDVMLGGIVFKVSGVVCKTFKEAAAAVVAQNPMLKSVVAAMESKFGKIEQYFVEKFNNQKILGGEGNKIYNVNNDVKVINSYGPLNEGPLPIKQSCTFRSSSYSELLVENPVELYRVYGGKVEALGNYWTPVKPLGQLQSQIDLALKPEWGNTADLMTTILVPKGEIIYQGIASSQGSLVGGGIQVYIPKVRPEWVIK